MVFTLPFGWLLIGYVASATPAISEAGDRDSHQFPAVFEMRATCCVAPGDPPTTSDTPKLIEVITVADASADASRFEQFLTALRTAPAASGLRWIGTTALTGMIGQPLAIFEYSDLESLRRATEVRALAMQAMPAEARPRLRSRVYELAPAQTFNDGLVPWGAAHAWVLYTVHLTAGGTDDYEVQQHIAAGYLRRAHVTDEEWIGFHMRYGSDLPGYVFVTPLRSVADLDAAVSHSDVLPPDVDRKRDIILREAIVNSDITLLVTRPELSSGAR
jgi:hypothetical protein